MFKKALCLFISIAFLSVSCVVSADTFVTGDVSNSGTATVSISTNSKTDTRYLFTVFKPGTVINNINVTGQRTENVLDFKSVTADTAEGYDFKDVTFDLGSYGVYIVAVGGGDLEEYKEIKIVYQSETDSQAAGATAVAAVQAGTIETVLENNNNVKWALDLGNSAYVNNKAIVLNNITEQINSISTPVTSQDVVNAYNCACALANLKTCSDTTKLADSILMYEDLLYSKNGSYPDNVEDGQFAGIFRSVINDAEMTEKGAQLESVADFESIIHITDALVEVNNADATTILAKLNAYDDVFNLDYTGDYTKVDKYELGKYMADLTVTYNTVKDVKDKFTSSIVALPKNGNAGGNGGGNGGSNGGGGGGGTTGGKSESIGGPNVTIPVVDGSIIGTLDEVAENSYSDIDEAEWAAGYIKYLTDNKIMSGDGNGKFRPNDNITREELLKLVVEALNFDKSNQSDKGFSDVNSNEWYAEYIATGINYGIVNGVSDTLFGVGSNVTRQDAAVMLYRALLNLGISFETDASCEFADAKDISDYAIDAVSALSADKVISGYETGEFKPNGKLTRAEAAKLVYSIIKIAV